MRAALCVPLAALLLAWAAPAAPAAQAGPCDPPEPAFGLCDLSLSFTVKPEGSEPEAPPSLRAGTHPFAMRTTLAAVLGEDGEPADAVRDLVVELPAGLVGNPTATPRCSNLDFFRDSGEFEGLADCEDSTAVGTIDLEIVNRGGNFPTRPLYNLYPPPGTAAKFGFVAGGVRVAVDVSIDPDPPHRVIARSSNTTQAVRFYSTTLEVWGVPADHAHDAERNVCLGPEEGDKCPAGVREKPFLTLPRSCTGPLEALFNARSWQDPASWLAYEVQSSDGATPPSPVATGGCERLHFEPRISAAPTSSAAESPTGLDFRLNVDDPGLTDPDGTAHSDIRRAVVTLPEGMTINPSQAEGLGVCTEAELARESATSRFGEGCPGASKIGTVEVTTPLLENRVLHGQMFVAEPYHNLAGDALIAFYIVIKDPELGILVKQPARVDPDPRTGQLITTTTEMPQLPFSEFRLRFKEGGRSPLITPPDCGTHELEALFTPWAEGVPAHPETATFAIDSGPRGGPCPAGPQPFEPGFEAGALNDAAGSFSPFAMRFTRRDGDQDLTRFDATLPPGVVAKLAGVPRCPEAAIAAAKAKTGKQEQAAPSCPAASQIGTVQGGAGVGSQLTYVPGKVYLAGPVGGAPLSVVGIVPAVAGPFDVGTIVVRQALDLDPITGRARVDGALSDPIPHILAGIPLRVRDIQVNVDRPGFTLNPTSCAELATAAGIWGGGADVFSTADDAPVLRSARFQAADCASLGFSPRLAIKLRGGTGRGAHPALRAVVTPREGDANFSRAAVTLPRSAFLDQAHIRTICTRVAFAAGPGHGALCPEGARYGFARAWSPLLDGPVRGPVYLRSSDNNLPDLVAALTGPPSAAVQVELSARIDSVRGGIRSTFTGIPDVPVSRFILDMQGGKKGLIVNSTNLCRKPARNRARANLRGQNGRVSPTRPIVRAVKCAKGRKKAKRARVSRARVATTETAGRR